MMTTLSSLIGDDVRALFQRKHKQLWLVTGLIAGLLFVFNVFLGLAFYGQEFSSGLKEKIGMYFYVVDSVSTDDSVYTQVTQLTKKLEDAGMETVFASKDEAFGFLQNRIPNVIENFKRFGINNPLPATLYVMFDNDQQYQILKDTIISYKSIISNSSDVDQVSTLGQQENRAVMMIQLGRFVVIVSFLLVIFLFVVVLALCGYMLHSLYADFHAKIDVKKLLGASVDQIIAPFLFTTAWVIGRAYSITIVLLLLLAVFLSVYMGSLFDTTIWSVVASYGWSFWLVICLQLLVMIGGLTAFAYYYVRHLIKIK